MSGDDDPWTNDPTTTPCSLSRATLMNSDMGMIRLLPKIPDPMLAVSIVLSFTPSSVSMMDSSMYNCIGIVWPIGGIQPDRNPDNDSAMCRGARLSRDEDRLLLRIDALLSTRLRSAETLIRPFSFDAVTT